MENRRQTVLVTGASGCIGNKIYNLLSKKYNCVGTYYSRIIPKGIKLDLTSKVEALKVFNQVKPDIIIHAAAEKDPDQVKKNPQRTFKLNVEATRTIKDFAKNNLCKIIHLSTSYVFPGKQKGRYIETDKCLGVNDYSKTKIQAEKIIELHQNYIILRFDMVFGYNGPDKENGLFGKIIKTKTEIGYDNKQKRQPMFIDDIARAVDFLLANRQAGIFHLGSDLLTKYKICSQLESLLDRGKLYVVPRPWRPDQAKRPGIIHLDCSKIAKLGFRFHSIQKSLAIIKEQYNNSKR